MRKIAFISILIFFGLALNAQTDQTPQRSKTAAKYKIIPVQFGTGTTIMGEYKIILESPIDLDYTIMLTPHSKPVSLYISDKKQESAIIKTNDKSDIEFDYIIFVKKPYPQPPEQ
jgi:hypothetical protein